MKTKNVLAKEAGIHFPVTKEKEANLSIRLF